MMVRVRSEIQRSYRQRKGELLTEKEKLRSRKRREMRDEKKVLQQRFQHCQRKRSEREKKYVHFHKNIDEEEIGENGFANRRAESRVHK